MTNEVTPVAERFALALDDEDYVAVRALLDDECEYLTPKGMLVGPEAILASYQEAAAWAKANVENVRYTSAVRGQEEDAVVTFYDHFEHRGSRHTYACEQLLHVNSKGLITRIIHQELPGELESAYAFLGSIGVSRH